MGLALMGWARMASAEGPSPLYTEQSRVGDGRPFAPIGLITPNSKIPVTPEGSTLSDDVMSSAILISPCYALASYHGTFGDIGFDKLDESKDHSVTFYVGQDPKSDFRYRSVAQPVAHGKFRVNADDDEDWALLKLEKCEGLNVDIGWIEASRYSWNSYATNSLFALGYGELQSLSTLIKTSPCSGLSTWAGEGSVLTNCPTIEGNSGGVVMGRRKDGVLVGVFMTVAGNEKNRNVGIDLAYLMRRPEFDVVRKDLMHWQVPNASQLQTSTAPQP